MLRFLTFLTACCSIIYNAKCANVARNKLEKPLFVPSPSYPPLVQIHPSGYNGAILENAPTFPQYAYGQDSLEYADSLQRQLLFQNANRRLEIIFQNKENEKRPEIFSNREDNYDQLANSLLFQEENQAEFNDLDRRYKRNEVWAMNSPPSKTEPKYPFGPYRFTTWIPYDDTAVKTSRLSARAKPAANANIRAKRKISISQSSDHDANLEQNVVRTERPFQTPELRKEFPDLSFFIPIQTNPSQLSDSKAESGFNAQMAAQQLLSLMISGAKHEN